MVAIFGAGVVAAVFVGRFFGSDDAPIGFGIGCTVMGVLLFVPYAIHADQAEKDIATATAQYVLDHKHLTPVEEAKVDLDERTVTFLAARANGDLVRVTTTWSEAIVEGSGTPDQLVKFTIDDVAN